MKTCYWSDGTWCHEEELEDYSWMSDDFVVLRTSEDLDDEEIASLVWRLTRSCPL